MTYLNDLPQLEDDLDLDRVDQTQQQAQQRQSAARSSARSSEQDEPAFFSPAAVIEGAQALILWTARHRRLVGLGAFSIVAVASIATLVGGISVALKSQGVSEIVTEAAPESQAARYDLQRRIVLDKAVPVFDEQGRQINVRPATLQELLDAAKVVMSKIESDTVQEKANDLDLAIAAGRRKDGHLCYGMTRFECINALDAQIGADWQEAVETNNVDEELKIQRLAQALDRVRQGDTQSINVERDLYLLARERYAEALDMAQRSSADGIAGSVLEQQVELNNQGVIFGE